LLFCWIPPYLFTSTRAKCIQLGKEAGCPDLSNRRTNKKLPKSSHKIKRTKWEQQKMGGGIDAGWLNDCHDWFGRWHKHAHHSIARTTTDPSVTKLTLNA
jgi:hypothetical protein